MGEPLDLRGPHKATRDVVDVDGAKFVKILYRWFDEMNVAHFAGELAPPLVLVASTSSPRAIGDHIPKDVHGLRSVVRLHPKLAIERGPLFLKDALLHEMVHVWQSEIAKDIEQGYRGHGPLFAARCNEIGAELGLPPVGLKGRNGLPDCAQWPMCVRPADYYPPAPPKKTRAKKAPPATAAGGEGGEQGDDGDRDDGDGRGESAGYRRAALACSRGADRLAGYDGSVLREAARILERLAGPRPLVEVLVGKDGAP